MTDQIENFKILMQTRFIELHNIGYKPIVGFIDQDLKKHPYRFFNTNISDYSFEEHYNNISYLCNTMRNNCEISNILILSFISHLDIIVVDLDIEKGKNLKINGPDLYDIIQDNFNTYTVRTRSGGIHMYFNHSYDITPSTRLNCFKDYYGDLLSGCSQKIVLDCYTYDYEKDSINNSYIPICGNLSKLYKYDEGYFNQLLQSKDIKTKKENKQDAIVKSKVETNIYIEPHDVKLINQLTELYYKISPDILMTNDMFLIYLRIAQNTGYFEIIDNYCKITNASSGRYDIKALRVKFDAIKTLHGVSLESLCKIFYKHYISICSVNHNDEDKTTIITILDALPIHLNIIDTVCDIDNVDIGHYNTKYILPENTKKNKQLIQEKIQYFTQYDTIMMMCPTGAGKTQTVAMICNELLTDNNKLKILSITSRQSLAYQQESDLKRQGLKINNYLTCNGKYKDNLIIQLESLGCHFSNELIKYYNGCILIIDEFSANLMHLALSSTFSNNSNMSRLKCIEIYTQLIQNAYKVIVLDADLKTTDAELLLNIRKQKTLLYKFNGNLTNTVNQNIPVIAYDCKYIMINNLLDHLHNISVIENDKIILTETVILVVDSKTKIDAIVEKYLTKYNDNILVYTKDKGNKTQLLNTIDTWTNRLVIYNQTISYGVSFDDKFNSSNVYYLNFRGCQVSDPLLIHQSLHRCRNIKQIHISIDRKNKDIMRDNEFISLTLENIKTIKSQSFGFGIKSININNDNIERFDKYGSSMNDYINNKLCKNIRYTLLHYLKYHKGYSITYNSDIYDAKIEETKQLNMLTNDLSKDKKDTIISILENAYETYNELIDNFNKDDIMQLHVERDELIKNINDYITNNIIEQMPDASTGYINSIIRNITKFKFYKNAVEILRIPEIIYDSFTLCKYYLSAYVILDNGQDRLNNTIKKALDNDFEKIIIKSDKLQLAVINNMIKCLNLSYKTIIDNIPDDNITDMNQLITYNHELNQITKSNNNKPIITKSDAIICIIKKLSKILNIYIQKNIKKTRKYVLNDKQLEKYNIFLEILAKEEALKYKPISKKHDIIEKIQHITIKQTLISKKSLLC